MEKGTKEHTNLVKKTDDKKIKKKKLLIGIVNLKIKIMKKKKRLK